MKTQEKLKIIEEQIRKDIPRLKQPVRGCLSNHDGDTFNILKVKDDYYKIENIKHGTSDICSKESFEKYFEIIGHEIMLNDVLEWLQNIDYFETSLDYPGFLIIKDFIQSKSPGNYDPLLGKNIDIDWDLSKPYLKDQSEELIDFLYDLIKSKILYT